MCALVAHNCHLNLAGGAEPRAGFFCVHKAAPGARAGGIEAHQPSAYAQAKPESRERDGKDTRRCAAPFGALATTAADRVSPGPS